MDPDFTELDKAAAPLIAAAVQAQETRVKSRVAVVQSVLADCVVELPGTLKQAVDVYHGPEGNGYVVRLIYEFNGERWLRCESGGPQSFRTHTWLKLRKF